MKEVMFSLGIFIRSSCLCIVLISLFGVSSAKEMGAFFGTPWFVALLVQIVIAIVLSFFVAKVVGTVTPKEVDLKSKSSKLFFLMPGQYLGLQGPAARFALEGMLIAMLCFRITGKESIRDLAFAINIPEFVAYTGVLFVLGVFYGNLVRYLTGSLK